MKEFIVYTAARLLVFVACFALVVGVWLLVDRDGPVPVLWPLIISAVLSAVVSAYLLRGMRDRFALRVQGRAERMSQRFEEMKAKEDRD